MESWDPLRWAPNFWGMQPDPRQQAGTLGLRRIFWPAEPVKKWISLFPAFAKAGTLRGFPQTRRRLPPPAGSGAPYNHTGLPSPKLGSRGSPTTKSAGAFAPALLVLFSMPLPHHLPSFLDGAHSAEHLDQVVKHSNEVGQAEIRQGGPGDAELVIVQADHTNDHGEHTDNEDGDESRNPQNLVLHGL